MKIKEKSEFKIVIIVGGIILAYGLYFLFLYSGFSELIDKDGALVGVRSGSFGDAFGTINALFSGLAFSGVVITIFLQRRDLKENQHDAVRQQVESQFYSMLRLQQEIVKGIDLQKTQFNPISNSSIQIVTQGRDCFVAWNRALHASYKRSLSLTGVDRIESAYGELWEKHRNDLGLYLRNLHNLFVFLSKSHHIDKRWLGSVVCSLISDYELVVLFYSCVVSSGPHFREYAVEFVIFQNLDTSLLFEEVDVLLLSKGAYGGNKKAQDVFRL